MSRKLFPIPLARIAASRGGPAVVAALLGAVALCASPAAAAPPDWSATLALCADGTTDAEALLAGQAALGWRAVAPDALPAEALALANLAGLGSRIALSSRDPDAWGAALRLGEAASAGLARLRPLTDGPVQSRYLIADGALLRVERTAAPHAPATDCTLAFGLDDAGAQPSLPGAALAADAPAGAGLLDWDGGFAPVHLFRPALVSQMGSRPLAIDDPVVAVIRLYAHHVPERTQP